MSRAVAHTSGHDRLFVSYDDLIERQRAEVDRLASFIGRPESVDEGLPSIRDYTDATLRHHQARIEAVIQDPELPFPAKALYLSLLLVTDLQHRRPDAASRASSVFEAAVDCFSSEAGRAQAGARERDRLESGMRAHVHALTAASQELSAVAQEKTAVAQEKGAIIETMRDILSARERERDDQRALIALLHEDLDATKAYARALEIDRETVRCDRDAVSRERDGVRELSSALREALDASMRRVAYVESPGGYFKTGLRALLPRRVYGGLRRVYGRRPVWLR
jgi:hypothetical protein